MTGGAIATLLAVLALGMVEALNRFYPARSTWLRLRSRNGRRAVRAMRVRFEDASTLKAPRYAALALAILVVLWIGVAGLLNNRWYEVVLDVAPYVLIGVAVLRVPAALRAMAARMKKYELDIGEDPDASSDGEGGPTALAL